MVDHFEPSVEQYEEAVKFIDEFKKKNEKVYVHCKAGHGRGAAVTLVSQKFYCAYEHVCLKDIQTNIIS